jgi:hypothetical protein
LVFLKRKLYLLREKNLHKPGACLLSVLKNDYASKKEINSYSDKPTANEIGKINRNERIASKRYYQEMDINDLPKQGSLK